MVLSSHAILTNLSNSCLMHSMRNRMRSAPFFLAGANVMETDCFRALSVADDVPEVEVGVGRRFHLGHLRLGAVHPLREFNLCDLVGTSYYGQAVDQSAISLILVKLIGDFGLGRVPNQCRDAGIPCLQLSSAYPSPSWLSPSSSSYSLSFVLPGLGSALICLTKCLQSWMSASWVDLSPSVRR